MSSRFAGVGTVVVSAGIGACGLFLLSGVGPSAANEVRLPAAAPTSTSDVTTTTTEPGEIATTTSTTTVEAATSTTTTSTTTTTTVVPTTSAPVTPVPLSVTASNTVVGAGGTVSFDGTCATGGASLGAITVWVVRDDRDDVDVIDTGLSSATWTFIWTAPTAEADFGSFTFQFWCGDPTGFEAGYPLSLQQRVDMVASAAPPASAPLIESAPVTPIIPETD